MQPDCEEGLRLVQGNDLVGLGSQRVACLGRTNGYGHHNARRAAVAQGAHRRAHRRARRQSVINDNDGSALDSWSRPSISETFLSATRLGHFLSGYGLQELVCDARLLYQRIIQVAPAVRRNCANSKLRLERSAQFAGYHDVQVRLETASDFSRYWHSSAWDAEYEHILASVFLQTLSELSSCVGAIAKDTQCVQEVRKAEGSYWLFHRHAS
jgi:hypothetical protein